MKTKILVYACVALLSFTSCEDWLSQNDPKELSEDQAYSSVASISSIAANLYERIKLDQNLLRIMNLMIYAGGMRLPVIVIIGNFRVMLVVPTVITMIII